MRDVRAFLNDGKGTAVSVSTSSAVVRVDSSVVEPSRLADATRLDIFVPEISVPTVVRDKNLHNNKFVLVFSAQDKDSGVSRFEVCEGRRACEAHESPYVLKNQRLTDEIAVKVYDNNNNRQIAMVPPPRPLYAGELEREEFNEKIILGVLIIGIGIFIFDMYRKRKYCK